MKKVVQLPSILIFTICFLPSWLLSFLSREEAYDPLMRSTLFLLSGMWLTGCQTIWLWSVGKSLSAKLDRDNETSLMPLKLSLAVPVLYVVLPIITLVGSLVAPNEFFAFFTFEHYQSLHHLTLIFFLYPVYLIAQMLTTIELGRRSQISEYIGTIITIAVFVIGIFFVQPRIKKVMKTNPDTYLGDGFIE